MFNFNRKYILEKKYIIIDKLSYRLCTESDNINDMYK